MGVGILLTAASGSHAGQAGKSLFPTGVGSRWTYKGTAAGQPLNMEAVVTSAKKAGGKTTVVFRWTMNGNPVQDETYIVTGSSVSRAKSGPYGQTSVSPPVPIIVNPMTVGKSWNWKGTITPPNRVKVAATATLKVAARETIKSAAGSFNAFRVDMELRFSMQGQNLRIPNSYWFAPGAGLVRQRATLGQVVIDATVMKVQVK